MYAPNNLHVGHSSVKKCTKDNIVTCALKARSVEPVEMSVAL
jgi:hypothetical protein